MCAGSRRGKFEVHIRLCRRTMSLRLVWWGMTISATGGSVQHRWSHFWSCTNQEFTKYTHSRHYEIRCQERPQFIIRNLLCHGLHNSASWITSWSLIMVIGHTKACSSTPKIKLLKHILQPKFWAKHIYFNSGLLECGTIYLDKWFPTFRRNLLPSLRRLSRLTFWAARPLILHLSVFRVRNSLFYET
jgi:hypothetical protein